MGMLQDNYDLWEEHDRQMCREEERAEKCAWCGEPIGDSYYQIHGDHVCEECIDGCRRYV